MHKTSFWEALKPKSASLCLCLFFSWLAYSESPDGICFPLRKWSQGFDKPTIYSIPVIWVHPSDPMTPVDVAYGQTLTGTNIWVQVHKGSDPSGLFWIPSIATNQECIGVYWFQDVKINNRLRPLLDWAEMALERVQSEEGGTSIEQGVISPTYDIAPGRTIELSVSC